MRCGKRLQLALLKCSPAGGFGNLLPKPLLLQLGGLVRIGTFLDGDVVRIGTFPLSHLPDLVDNFRTKIQLLLHLQPIESRLRA
jgi:hypothetical protein